MAAVMCDVTGCKNWAKDNGKCSAHAKSYRKKLEGDEGASTAVMVAVVSKVIKKDGYYGGAADEPHVHVYASGAHLKLGKHRYNLVQDGKKYSSVAAAYEALDEHALGDTLRPWVDAALKYFGVD